MTEQFGQVRSIHASRRVDHAPDPLLAHSQGDAIWIAGHALATVIMRMVMGWMYAFGGRSLFLAVVFHAMINTSLRLFPNDGSHYDPPVTAALLAGMAVLMAVSLMITRRVLRAAA